jgi:Major Facilitator Superfamily
MMTQDGRHEKERSEVNTIAVDLGAQRVDDGIHSVNAHLLLESLMAKRSRFFYGWLILGCAVLVMALASGTRMSFGIAMLPLSEQFVWTRTLLSTIALMTGIIGGLLQMGMGILVDRYGARRLLGSGVALLGLGVWLLTVSTTVWQFGLAYGVLVGIGMAAMQQVVTATLVANWFERHRGFAQSLLATAGAIGWMIVVPARSTTLTTTAHLAYSAARPIHDERDPDERDTRTHKIKLVRGDSINLPSPQQRKHDEHAAIGGIDASEMGRL